jgi:hypothetical protein
VTYELWDLPSGNALGEFATEGEALAAVRGLLADHGAGAVAGLLLARTTARGRSRPVAQGQALAALAGAAAGPATAARRTAVPA